jgi:sugar-specific transcriptional regulator TrmB
MKQLLTKLGLTPIETKIYELLVAQGALSVAAIAQNSGLYRPQIYRYLPLLIDKGLVAESRHGRRKIYLAESPRNLEKLADKLKADVQEQLPALLQLYNTSETKPLVRYFEGTKGIRHVYEDLVASCKKGDIFYRYESPRNYRAVRKYIPDEYRTRIRDRGEVERLIITNEITNQQKKQRLGRLIKIVPPEHDLFVYDITQLIYGNKVAFIDFRSETATLIESPIFAEFQKKLFKLLFDKL